MKILITVMDYLMAELEDRATGRKIVIPVPFYELLRLETTYYSVRVEFAKNWLDYTFYSRRIKTMIQGDIF